MFILELCEQVLPERIQACNLARSPHEDIDKDSFKAYGIDWYGRDSRSPH